MEARVLDATMGAYLGYVESDEGAICGDHGKLVELCIEAKGLDWMVHMSDLDGAMESVLGADELALVPDLFGLGVYLRCLTDVVHADCGLAREGYDRLAWME